MGAGLPRLPAPLPALSEICCPRLISASALSLLRKGIHTPAHPILLSPRRTQSGRAWARSPAGVHATH